NTDKRDRRPALDLLEHEVGCVRGNAAEVGAGEGEHIDTFGDVIRQVVESSSVEHRNAFVDIEAVDEDVRVSAVSGLSAIARNDEAVVVDSGFGAKPADDA